MGVGAAVRRFATVDNVLHVLFVSLSATLAFLSFNGSLFAWHPFLMSFAYLFFMAEGVLGAVQLRRVEGVGRLPALNQHMWLQLRAVLFATAGAVVIIYNKAIHNKHHFTSLHARVGLATLILTALAPLGGLISFRRLRLLALFPERLHGRIKAAHRWVGSLTWFLSLLVVELALPHSAVHKAWWTPAWQLGVVAAAALMLLLMLRGRQQSSGGMPSVLKAV